MHARGVGAEARGHGGVFRPTVGTAAVVAGLRYTRTGVRVDGVRASVCVSLPHARRNTVGTVTALVERGKGGHLLVADVGPHTVLQWPQSISWGASRGGRG